jgi:hypothetical protein
MTEEKDPLESADAPEDSAKPFEGGDYTTRDDEADALTTDAAEDDAEDND